jgi:hypothetical protein
VSASKSATWPWSFNRPARQKRQPVWRSPEEVIQRVTRLYGFTPPSDLVKPTRRPSEARQVALYGLRWWAGEGLSAIARRMGVKRQCGESAGHGGGTAAQGGRTVSEPCRASDKCQTPDLTPDRHLLLSAHNSAIN